MIGPQFLFTVVGGLFAVAGPALLFEIGFGWFRSGIAQASGEED